MRALETLTHVVDGNRQIVHDPPLIERLMADGDQADLVARIEHGLHEYRRTLPPDRRFLFDEFQLQDMARKVVGVGSVGTRCYIVLFEGKTSDDPLFLQVKEAQASVLEPYLGKNIYKDNGERVVVGQRRMQAASDIFLGWYRSADNHDFYVRQLADLKGSVPIESVRPTGLSLYGRICGGTLARAHARTGDSVQIAAYLGQSLAFEEALATFAEAYAGQTERDYRELVEAHKSGRIQASSPPDKVPTRYQQRSKPAQGPRGRPREGNYPPTVRNGRVRCNGRTVTGLGHIGVFIQDLPTNGTVLHSAA